MVEVIPENGKHLCTRCGIVLEDVGCSFIGMQETGHDPVPTFNDLKTKTTMLLHPGETIAMMVERSRSKFVDRKEN
jgi:hypothetical protein